MFALNFVACPGMLDVDVWDDGCGRILKFNPAPPPSIVPHSSAWRWRETTLAEIIKNWFHILHIENIKILQVKAIWKC